MTPLELNDLVYEQWLMADIQESSVPRLPGEIGNVEICKVEGYFNLQVGQLITMCKCTQTRGNSQFLDKSTGSSDGMYTFDTQECKIVMIRELMIG